MKGILPSEKHQTPRHDVTAPMTSEGVVLAIVKAELDAGADWLRNDPPGRVTNDVCYCTDDVRSEGVVFDPVYVAGEAGVD